MEKEEDFLEKAPVSDPGRPLQKELVDIDVVAESLEASQEFPEVPQSASEAEEDSEVNFDNQADPSFKKDPKPFIAVQDPRKRDALSVYL